MKAPYDVQPKRREVKHILVGIAGWSNPPSQRAGRQAGQSHLVYYAEHFACVEVNSTFYRPHRKQTYLRWREETPPHFRFSVKMPASITHEARLRHCAAEVARFYEEAGQLQPKLAAVLLQLPPSLEFNVATFRAFFKKVPALHGTVVACEPRHASWFTPAANDALLRASVSRVAADPVRPQSCELPGGARSFAYYRWHGTPRIYYSKYTDAQLVNFAADVTMAAARTSWCIFDNTARYAAWDDALRFMRVVATGPRSTNRTPG